MTMTRNLAVILLLSWFTIGGSRAQTDVAAPFTADVPTFAEQASAAGIEHHYTGPWEFFVGGGVASFDCNQDRKPDLLLAGGDGEISFLINHSDVGGALRFQPADIELSARDSTNVLGAYPIDFDNDRVLDLVVLRLGENLLLKGSDNCRFTKVNRQVGFDGGIRWTTGFSATWEKDQAFPTLAIGNYVDRSAPGSPWGTCHPNILMRSQNTAEIDYSAPRLLEPGHCSLSVLFTDWDRSGIPALRVTNDRQYHRGGQEQLWQVAPGRPARQYSTTRGWKRLVIWGMGIAEADLDADGRPEYALSSMGDTKLQTLDDNFEGDQPTYTDIAFARQATAHRPYFGDDRRPSTGWHTQFADVNNDSHWDLFIAKGNVEKMPDFANFDPDNLLMGSQTGMFFEAGDKAGVALPRVGRGAAVDDYNMDGQLDLVVVNRNGPASLFRNLGRKTDWGHSRLGNWTKIQLDNGDINPSAIGAKISVKTGNHNQNKTLQIGGGHASGQLGFTHFGLGVAERATIRVQWPDGEWSHPYRIFANQHVVITRGAAEASYWYPH
jgi:hypothetical protein